MSRSAISVIGMSELREMSELRDNVFARSTLAPPTALPPHRFIGITAVATRPVTSKIARLTVQRTRAESLRAWSRS